MTAIASPELPVWLRGRTLLRLGYATALVVVCLTAAFLWREHRTMQAREIASVELYARVLQDHAERTFDTVDVALASLADSIVDDVARDALPTVDASLVQVQRGLPFLRSLSVIDGEGRVLASSSARNVGILVDLVQVPLPRPSRLDILGPLVHGRDLADVAARASPSGDERSRRTFLPLVRAVGPAAQPGRFLVAVLNSDFFANEHELTLADASRDAALVEPDGTLISTTGNLRHGPGESVASLIFFRQFLPAIESGSYVGAGIDGRPVFSAFRVLRKRPLVVIVEHDCEPVAAAFASTVAWAVGGCGTGLAIMTVMLASALRSLRRLRAAERGIREARDAADRANSAKSEFIANISHELRTPLQGIVGFSELGSEIASDRPELLEMFSDIQSAGRRMATLVDGLLDVARMDDVVRALPLERMDVAQLVLEAVGEVSPAAAERGQQIRLDGIDAPQPAGVDPQRFRQALGHVLANALRFGPAESVVHLSVEREDGDRMLSVVVRDSGPGIPPDELESVFEAFVQSSRTRDGSGGTGLGLTLARKIMKAHGGNVTVANRQGGGAVVRLTLPSSGAA